MGRRRPRGHGMEKTGAEKFEIFQIFRITPFGSDRHSGKVTTVKQRNRRNIESVFLFFSKNNVLFFLYSDTMNESRTIALYYHYPRRTHIKHFNYVM